MTGERPRPWVVHPDELTISLYEHLRATRRDSGDPTGHHRLLACGAALATMLVVARALGRDVRFELYPDRGQPDEVGRIDALARRAPIPRDLALYQAVSRVGPRSSVPMPMPMPGLPPGLRLVPVTDDHGDSRYLVVTDADGSRDRVLAGLTAQQVALAARAAGRTAALIGLPRPEGPRLPGRAQVEVRLRDRAPIGRTVEQRRVGAR